MPNRIRREQALPLDLLADDAVHELELRSIWHQDWVFAAPADLIAEPGDYLPVTVGDQRIILVRGDDLEIRALANVCSHRGAPLVDCPGRAARLSCPYHAWTYANDGSLVSVPYTMPDEVDADAYGLARFACATWHGLVFVNLDREAAAFDRRVETIEPYVRPLALRRLVHAEEPVRDECWQANWKSIFANALDAYSNFRLHAETVEPTNPTDGAYYLAGSATATVTGGESLERADHLVISLPPSFVAVVHPDAMVWMALSPTGVDQTQVRIGIATESGPTDESGHSLGPNLGRVDEDRQICEALQRNARSRTEPGPLISIERAIGDFHDYLRWRLTGDEPAQPLVAAPPGERPSADDR